MRITTERFIKYLQEAYGLRDCSGNKIDCDDEGFIVDYKYCLEHCPAQSWCSQYTASDDLACVWDGMGDDKAEAYGFVLTDYDEWYAKQ